MFLLRPALSWFRDRVGFSPLRRFLLPACRSLLSAVRAHCMIVSGRCGATTATGWSVGRIVGGHSSLSPSNTGEAEGSTTRDEIDSALSHSDRAALSGVRKPAVRRHSRGQARNAGCNNRGRMDHADAVCSIHASRCASDGASQPRQNRACGGLGGSASFVWRARGVTIASLSVPLCPARCPSCGRVRAASRCGRFGCAAGRRIFDPTRQLGVGWRRHSRAEEAPGTGQRDTALQLSAGSAGCGSGNRR